MCALNIKLPLLLLHRIAVFQEIRFVSRPWVYRREKIRIKVEEMCNSIGSVIKPEMITIESKYCSQQLFHVVYQKIISWCHDFALEHLFEGVKGFVIFLYDVTTFKSDQENESFQYLRSMN